MCAPLARGPALVQSKLLQSTIAFSLTAALNQSSGRLAGADGGSKDPASSGTRSGPRAQARPCGPVTTSGRPSHPTSARSPRAVLWGRTGHRPTRHRIGPRTLPTGDGQASSVMEDRALRQKESSFRPRLRARMRLVSGRLPTLLLATLPPAAAARRQRCSIGRARYAGPKQRKEHGNRGRGRT